MTARETANPRRQPAGTVGREPSRTGRRAQLRLVRPERDARSGTDAAVLARTDLLLLVGASAALTALGLVMVLSAGSVSAAQGYDGNSFWYFQRQLVYAAVGIVGAIVIARISPARWRAIGPVLLAATSVLMLTLVPPHRPSFHVCSRWPCAVTSRST